MSDKHTFLFIDSKGKANQISLSSAKINIILLVLAFFLMLLGLFFYDYWKINQSISVLDNTYIEKQSVKDNYLEKQIQIQTIEEKIKDIHIFETKIKNLLGIPKGKTYKVEELPESNSDQSQIDPFQQKLNFFESQVNRLYANFIEHDNTIYEKKALFDSTPSIIPAQGWISSYFGPRKSPYAGTTKMHEGLDVAASIGTPIVAPANGIVSFSGKKTGFGLTVKIDHGYGIQTVYAHASKLMVKAGTEVKRGHQIAKVGNTGWSTGPHLHYEIHVNGVSVDPFYFIFEKQNI